MNKDVTHFYIPVSKSLPSALPTFSSDSDYFQAMKVNGSRYLESTNVLPKCLIERMVQYF